MVASFFQSIARQSPRLTAIAALFVLAMIRLIDPQFMQTLRDNTFDTYQRIAPREVPSLQERPIVIAAVDEKSIVKFGAWPWPRTVYTQLNKKLKSMEAKVVAYDILFSEPRDKEGDLAFAQSLERLTAIVGLGAHWENIETLKPNRSPLHTRTAFKFNGTLVLTSKTPSGRQIRYFYQPKRILRNIGPVENAAAGNGMVVVYPDSDGVLRLTPTVFWNQDRLYPSLFLETFRIAVGANMSVAELSGHGAVNSIVLSSPTYGSIRLPTDNRGNIRPYFARRDSGLYISIADIFDDVIPQDRIAGKVVFIGSNALAIGDRGPSPLYANLNGVEYHAQAVEAALDGQLLIRPSHFRVIELFVILVGGIVLIVAMPMLRLWWMVVCSMGAVVSAIGVSWYLFATHRILFDATSTILAVLLLYLILVTGKLLQLEKVSFSSGSVANS